MALIDDYDGYVSFMQDYEHWQQKLGLLEPLCQNVVTKMLEISKGAYDRDFSAIVITHPHATFQLRLKDGRMKRVLLTLLEEWKTKMGSQGQEQDKATTMPLAPDSHTLEEEEPEAPGNKALKTRAELVRASVFCRAFEQVFVTRFFFNVWSIVFRLSFSQLCFASTNF